METPEMREARSLWRMFGHASDGEQVMDGRGIIWAHHGGAWYSGPRNHQRQVSSLVLARALCPDLYEELGEVRDEEEAAAVSHPTGGNDV